MASDIKQSIKQLKVDNWGSFFLQRLQLLFAKGDCCDLILKFKDGHELKVHRLVLNTCTSYFEGIPVNNNVISLPETLSYSSLQPIVNFMYSGQLEFKPELHPVLLSTAKTLNMGILIKLLNTQKTEDATGSKIFEGKKTPGTPSTKMIAASSSTPISSTMSGKKLPIWRKRTVPYHRVSDCRQLEEEDPRPTRFEWPGEDASTILMSSPSFAAISYESMPVLQSPPVPTPVLQNKQPLKRRVVPAAGPAMEKVQKIGEEGESVIQDVMSDDDYDDDGHFETLHTYDDSDDEPETPNITQLKPILKPTTDSHNSTPSKKVRFSLENEDKENADSKTPKSFIPAPVQEPDERTEKVESVPNHAKIIAEVLKKFPELVKNNKNIKLKITAPGSSSSKPTNLALDNIKGKVTTKASYVVMKSDLKPDKLQTSEKNLESSSVENTTGPWFCKTCASEEQPLNFESYYLFRKHLQDVHMERIDSRICEHCGYKASKRNLHLYHLYTKHDIPPPKNIKFPKCNYCQYIALSESILIKHQNSHQNTRELTCHYCNTIFKTTSSLQTHILTCTSNSELRNYICKNCKKCFRTTISLNAHVKECQDKGSTSMKNENQQGENEMMGMIEVPVIETVGMEKGQHTLLQLPTGLILTETPNMTLLPSSESDALNNVASGIATSIGLTVATLPEDQAVILLDENSELFLQSNNTVMIQKRNSVEEFIVPEIMPEGETHLYTSETSLPYTVRSGNVIAYPVMHVENNKVISPNIATEVIPPLKVSNTKDIMPTTSEASIVSRTDNNHKGNQSKNVPAHLEPVELDLAFAQASTSNAILLEKDQRSKHSLENNVHNAIENKMIIDTTKVEKSDKSKRGQTITVIQDGSNVSNRQEQNDNMKAKTIVKDWDFENDDDSSDIIDDPDVKPSRPTIDLQEII